MEEVLKQAESDKLVFKLTHNQTPIDLSLLESN